MVDNEKVKIGGVPNLEQKQTNSHHAVCDPVNLFTMRQKRRSFRIVTIEQETSSYRRW